jgi:hypothetical protein
MTQKLHDPACYDLATHFLGAALPEIDGVRHAAFPGDA